MPKPSALFCPRRVSCDEGNNVVSHCPLMPLKGQARTRVTYQPETRVKRLLQYRMCGIEDELREENLVAALVYLESKISC